MGYWSTRKAKWRSRGIKDVDTLDWIKLVEDQNNLCYVCDAPITAESARRDHDHETGLTRAAVCGHRCNMVMDLIASGVLCRVDP